MANNGERSANQEKVTLPSTFDNLLSLIDKLAGDKSNIKLDVQDLKLNIEGTRVTVNGEVNLDVVYSKEAET
jgi:hypothetical protein